ncbi:hypothetical protein [Actinophytocola oryzae]|uniref:Uncharacterized protein n=1 Tax=Actinophytocola oryzae TaxID=502181 RepID=A0A4R7VQK0_9PSEU|nr:hypothetical protein [Actinophytocola oryzae]TDV51902.1 hypothetical protein CLV71_10531 [Actinophytocola oryzae]
MQSTIELDELDALVAELDAEVGETIAVGEAQTIGSVVCSLACSGHCGGAGTYVC